MAREAQKKAISSTCCRRSASGADSSGRILAVAQDNKMTTQAISRQLQAGGLHVRRGENLHATNCEQSHSHYKYVSPTICNYPLKSVGVSVTHGKSSYSDLRGSTRGAGVWHRCFRAHPIGPSPLTNFGAEIYAPNRPEASAGIPRWRRALCDHDLSTMPPTSTHLTWRSVWTELMIARSCLISERPVSCEAE